MNIYIYENQIMTHIDIKEETIVHTKLSLLEIIN